ncbi:MAG TPA: phosphorylase [Xanthobacteraceae bacterium]|nr:phosphorylase [Xanthobacteraceae bacterium]
MPSLRPSEELTIAAVMCLAFEARIAAAAGVTVICNGRRERLRDQVQRACEHASGLISFGVAGGLDPRVRAGDWVVAASVVTPTGRYPTDLRWTRQLRAALPRAHYADLSGLDAPVADPATKLALGRRHGTVAIDTESHVVAEEAARCGMPFVVARVVLDPAWRALPPAALVSLKADGNPDIGGVARSVLRTPLQSFALGRITADAVRAWAALRRGRLALGPRFALPGAASELDRAAVAMTGEAVCELSTP